MQQIPVYAVIVAGGQGTRMGTAVPKQFLELNGKPILYHTIKAFLDAFPEMQLVLVLPEYQISYAQMVLQSFPDRIDITIVSGGETRFHSVKNGLEGIPSDAIIFVHDGVRPLISTDMIKRCYDQAVEKGSAIPAVPATDSMRTVEATDTKPLNRDLIRLIQTPQTFKASILLPAMQQEYHNSFTDEATVVEKSGERIFLIEGEKQNIKITTPEDLIIAEAFMKAKDL